MNDQPVDIVCLIIGFLSRAPVCGNRKPIRGEELFGVSRNMRSAVIQLWRKSEWIMNDTYNNRAHYFENGWIKEMYENDPFNYVTSGRYQSGFLRRTQAWTMITQSFFKGPYRQFEWSIQYINNFVISYDTPSYWIYNNCDSGIILRYKSPKEEWKFNQSGEPLYRTRPSWIGNDVYEETCFEKQPNGEFRARPNRWWTRIFQMFSRTIQIPNVFELSNYTITTQT